jgi:DNA polymerase-1
MTSKTIAIIDGDPLLWVASYYNKDEATGDNMLLNVDNMITEILANTKADGYCGFIEGPQKSHRHRLFADYKGNRPPKPDWFTRWQKDLEYHLINNWKFEYANGIETDDAIASAVHILSGKGEVPVICSGDKDFGQIPGHHYNPKTKESKVVSPLEARTFVLTQTLTGDSTDNIKGIPGVGPVKAKSILEDPTKEQPHAVLDAYLKFHNNFNMGYLDFAENVIKIVLKVNPYFQFSVNSVPEFIKTPKSVEF